MMLSHTNATMPTPRTPRRRLAALAVTAIALTAPGLAAAAPYEITTCGDTGGAGGWVAYGNAAAAGKIDRGTQCPVRDDGPGVDSNWSPYRTGLFVSDVRQTSTDTPQGADAGWQFNAPAGTVLTRAQVWRAMRKMDDNSWRAYWKLGPHDAPGVPERDDCTIPVGTTACGVGAWGWGPASYTDFSGLSTSAISFGLRCEMTAPYPCINGYSLYTARSLLYRAQLTLDDPTPPPTPSAAGAGWTATGWQSGSVTLSVSGDDPQSGISRTRIYVDDVLVSTVDRTEAGCDWSMPTPCPAAVDVAQTIDTTQLSDGSHDIEIGIVNAAGEETRRTRPAPLRVSNRSPSAATGLVAVRRNATNIFDVSWRVSTGAGAPVMIARYQVCPAAGCGPVQDAPTLTGVAGVELPGTADGTLKVWLTNEIGATSDPATAPLPYLVAPVDPRDPQIDPRDPPVDPGGPGENPPARTPPQEQPPGGAPGEQQPTDPGSRPTPAKRAAALRISQVWPARATLKVKGTIAGTATGRVVVTVSARVGRTSRTFTAKPRIARGRWSAGVKIPVALRGRGLVLAVRYGGDRATRPATLPRRAVRLPR